MLMFKRTTFSINGVRHKRVVVTMTLNRTLFLWVVDLMSYLNGSLYQTYFFAVIVKTGLNSRSPDLQSQLLIMLTTKIVIATVLKGENEALTVLNEANVEKDEKADRLEIDQEGHVDPEELLMTDEESASLIDNLDLIKRKIF